MLSGYGQTVLDAHLQCKYTTRSTAEQLSSNVDTEGKEQLPPGTDPAKIITVTTRTVSKVYAWTKYTS